MKKNIMMRLASGLLVAVLLTTCAISGTFAKYVTEGKGFDTARVAKFGVDVTATGSMFKTEYDTDKTFKTVVSSNEDKVIAPGTSGDLGGVTITGTPEVAVEVKFEATEVKLDGKWEDKDENFYCPLEITVGEKTISGLKYTDMACFVDDIKKEIESYSKVYGPNTTLAGENLGLSWAWAFENGKDVEDTYLGDQAADGNASSITITIATTVTQID